MTPNFQTKERPVSYVRAKLWKYITLEKSFYITIVSPDHTTTTGFDLQGAIDFLVKYPHVHWAVNVWRG